MQEMVTGTIIGSKQERGFGAVVMFGMGGDFEEGEGCKVVDVRIGLS